MFLVTFLVWLAANPTPPVVEVEFRFVRTDAYRDPKRPGSDRYVTEIEVVVTRPNERASRTRVRVPNAGCGAVSHDPIGTMQCYANAHGEYLTVERPRRDLLVLRQFGQDEAFPDYVPPIEHDHVVTSLRIPKDADIHVADAFESVSR